MWSQDSYNACVCACVRACAHVISWFDEYNVGTTLVQRWSPTFIQHPYNIVTTFPQRSHNVGEISQRWYNVLTTLVKIHNVHTTFSQRWWKFTTFILRSHNVGEKSQRWYNVLTTLPEYLDLDTTFPQRCGKVVRTLWERSHNVENNVVATFKCIYKVTSPQRKIPTLRQPKYNVVTTFPQCWIVSWDGIIGQNTIPIYWF